MNRRWTNENINLQTVQLCNRRLFKHSSRTPRALKSIECERKRDHTADVLCVFLRSQRKISIRFFYPFLLCFLVWFDRQNETASNISISTANSGLKSLKKSIKSASNLFFYVPVWLFRFFSLDFDFDSLQITSKVWVDLDLMDHQTLSNLF